MSHVVDLSGKTFGQLRVVCRDESRKGGSAYWICKCSCGNNSSVVGRKLSRGSTVSCGCLHGCFKKKDITGQKFGMLTVLSRASRIGSKYKWLCRCDCGEQKEIWATCLRSGSSKSCGCQNRGSNHYKWNPSLTDEDRLNDRRLTIGVAAWRKKVFVRDGYACQRCGDRTGGNLNAHHLDSWDTYPEKRLSLDNGITLCDECHKGFHVKYGFGGNNETQMIEFLIENDKNEK